MSTTLPHSRKVLYVRSYPTLCSLRFLSHQLGITIVSTSENCGENLIREDVHRFDTIAEHIRHSANIGSYCCWQARSSRCACSGVWEKREVIMRSLWPEYDWGQSGRVLFKITQSLMVGLGLEPESPVFLLLVPFSGRLWKYFPISKEMMTL
jgi:hypothetical protein